MLCSPFKGSEHISFSASFFHSLSKDEIDSASATAFLTAFLCCCKHAVDYCVFYIAVHYSAFATCISDSNCVGNIFDCLFRRPS